MLGLGAASQTTRNLLRTSQCVLNLVSDTQHAAVNLLARTTGTPEETPHGSSGYGHFKRVNGYRYVKDKFGHAGLTQMEAELVVPMRVAECPAQMEAVLVAVHGMAVEGEEKEEGEVEKREGKVEKNDGEEKKNDGKEKEEEGKDGFLALEVRVLRTHVHEEIRMVGHANRIDPDKWRPMIMSFQQLYGLAPKMVAPSVLANIGEEAYRPFSNEIEVPVDGGTHPPPLPPGAGDGTGDRV